VNKKDLNLLLPAITAILAVASYFICSDLLMPTIADNTSKITAYDQEIASANTKLDSISAADKSMTELSSVVNNLLIAVPDNVNAPDLITEIEAIASQSQVVLPSLSPPSAAAAGGASGVASGKSFLTSLTVFGSFQNINTFINSLETSIRFSKINNLSLSASETGLSASITLEVYSRPAISSSTGVSQ